MALKTEFTTPKLRKATKGAEVGNQLLTTKNTKGTDKRGDPLGGYGRVMVDQGAPSYEGGGKAPLKVAVEPRGKGGSLPLRPSDPKWYRKLLSPKSQKI